MYLSFRLAIFAVFLSLAAAFLPLPISVISLIIMGALGLFVAVDVALAPHASELIIERHTPTVSSIGRTDEVAVEVSNPRPRDVEVAFRDAAPPSLRRHPRIHRTVIPAGGRTMFRATITPARRGIRNVGPVTIRTAGPLRMAGRQSTLLDLVPIKVYPPLPGRANVAQRVRRARELQVGTRSSAYRGGGNEFDSLREYHLDDEFRRIDWRATARAGKPITRVYREERDQQVILLLDAGRSMAGTIAGASRFEHAIDAAFTLSELAAYVGDRVGMVAFGARVERMIGPKGGREQPRRILDLLFDLEPTLDAPDYRRAFSTLLGRYRRRALLVVLTELTDERAMEPFLDALPALRARHLVVVGSVQDPEVAFLATDRPADAEAAYLTAAASESLVARERTAERLRTMGIPVEDRLPGEFAAAIADRYLDIKSAGRL